MTQIANPWTGLGQRGASAPPPSIDLEDNDDGQPIRRIVDASTATPLAPTVARSVFDVTPLSQQRPDESPETPITPNHQEKPLPKKEKTARRGRPVAVASPRFQICALLMSKGDLSLEELKADVSADTKAFSNALFNAKAAEHIVFVAKSDKYHITKDGREWTTGGANLANQQATPPAERTPRKPRAPKATAPTSTAVQQMTTALTTDPVREIQVVQERSFRCAVFSDGGFHLSKAGQQIDLKATELSEMLRYLERMAEQTA